MAVMQWEHAQILSGLGFKEARDGDHWCRQFNLGFVKTILLVRDTVVGFEYRFLVADPAQHRSKEQWMDLVYIPRAILTLLHALHVGLKARRALEGGLARRTLRRIGW